MASMKQAATATLDVVTMSATTLVNTFDTINDSVMVANNFVKKHLHQQKYVTAAELDMFKEMRQRELSLELYKQDGEIVKIVGNNPDDQARFNKHMDRIKAIFDKVDGKIAESERP